MNNNLVNEITARQLRQDIPDFSSGDTIKVYVRIIENKKERNQVFEGVVMQRRGSGVSATFTVRKISAGIGVERTFPVNAPSIAKIEVVKHGQSPPPTRSPTCANSLASCSQSKKRSKREIPFRDEGPFCGPFSFPAHTPRIAKSVEVHIIFPIWLTKRTRTGNQRVRPFPRKERNGNVGLLSSMSSRASSSFAAAPSS